MANKNEILEQINIYKGSGQDIIRRQYVKELSDFTGKDTICYFSSFSCRFPNVPSDLLSISTNDIQGFMTSIHGLKGKSLDLILHSPGGSLQAAEQIVQYLRSKYDHIRAIVPQNAMSAATMIACACDEIVLGKESAIGPIDPQMSILIPGVGSTPIPAHSIIEDFEKAKNDVLQNPQLAAIWIPKLSTIPHGYLDFCEKTIRLSITKVAEWLNAYMFKNTEKKGQEIAGWLGDFKEHLTHGRPINYDLALSKGLNVSRLEDNQDFQDKVLSIYHASLITFEATQCVKIIENHLGKGSYTVLNFQ